MSAAVGCKLEAVKYLFNQPKIDPKATGRNGSSANMLALQSAAEPLKSIQTLQVLYLKDPTSVLMRDDDGQDLMHLALRPPLVPSLICPPP
jgi:hypothetical protein